MLRCRFAAIRNSLLTILIMLMTVAACGHVWGRAGGGGGYSGGGHSSGGGFSGGSHFSGGGYSGGGHGGGSGIPINGTTVFIFLLIIMIIIAIQVVNNRYQAQQVRIIRSVRRQADLQALQDGKAALLARDPDFDETQFLARIKTAFGRVQDAWAGQNMPPVRHLVSDGIFERYTLQLEMMKESGIVNRVEQLEIREAVIASLESDACFDSVDVYIRASAVDWYANLKTGQPVYGDREPAEFAEYWTFLRRPGAKTLQRAGLVEDCCPNCGAPLDIADRCECSSCHAVVNSGDYDWVLTEITQECEWQYHPPRAVPGTEELLARDPSFNIRHLEDRVSVMFYRWIAAQFMADPKYLRKLAADTYMQTEAGLFRPQADGKRMFYADAAVGTVETVEVIAEEEYDQARVRVKWSGHRLAAAIPGLLLPDFEQSRLYIQEYILTRKAGVTSSVRNILSSSHCPNCGAPETLSDRACCEYCQAPLNDGSRDWVLTEIRPFSGYTCTAAAAPSASDDQLSGIAFFDERDGESLVMAAVSLMLADGEISEKEMQLLRRFAAQRRIMPDRLNSIIASIQSKELEITLPSDRATAIYFLRCLILMCLADGKISPSERKLLCALADNMKIPFKEVELMIREERNRLLGSATKTDTE